MDVWAPSDRANVFVINHDGLMHGDMRQGRVTYLDNNLYNLANAFMLAYPYGQPVVLSRCACMHVRTVLDDTLALAV